MNSLNLRYLSYGAIIAVSLSALAVSAGTEDGVFGDYFTRITGDCATNSVVTGFDNSHTNTYGTRKCSSIQSIIGSLFGASSAPAGQAMIGFDTNGNPKYGDVGAMNKVGSNLGYTGGNVGIGTENPSHKLTVTGGGVGGKYGLTPDYADWNQFGTGDGGAAIYNDNGAHKKLMIVGNSSAGGTREVGIWDNLSVAGNANIAGNLSIGGNFSARNIVSGDNSTKTSYIANPNSILPSGFYNTVGSSNTPDTSWWHIMTDRHYNENNHYAFQIGSQFWGGGSNSYLRTIEDGVSQPWRKIITAEANGNVGIGIANPTKKLDIAGDINITGNIYKNGVLLNLSGGSGIGTDQTWKEMKNFRSLDTQYTNTTSKPIMVNVTVGPNPNAGWGEVLAKVDGVVVANPVGNWNGGAGNLSVSFIVPVGSVYTISGGGRLPIKYWAELTALNTSSLVALPVCSASAYACTAGSMINPIASYTAVGWPAGYRDVNASWSCANNENTVVNCITVYREIDPTYSDPNIYYWNNDSGGSCGGDSGGGGGGGGGSCAGGGAE